MPSIDKRYKKKRTPTQIQAMINAAKQKAFEERAISGVYAKEWRVTRNGRKFWVWARQHPDKRRHVILGHVILG